MAQQTVVTLKIREMILRGELKAGERVTELDLAERLGLSRTPIRSALPALAKEGLLTPHGGRGYSVRVFTAEDSLSTLRVRAILEGVAARAVAISDGAEDLVRELEPLLAKGDALLRSRRFSRKLEVEYGEINEQFHTAIVRAANQPILTELIDRCNVAPFVSPGRVAFKNTSQEQVIELLTYAHRQHHAIVDALAHRDGSRVEMLLREHAYTQEYSLVQRSAASPA